MPKVLFVLTSHDKLGDTGRSTGYYVPEAAHPHHELREAGIAVDFATITGGRPPIDGYDADDPIQRAFVQDAEITRALDNAPRLADVDSAGYDAVLFVGGHGTMWDFPENADVQRLIREIYERGGIVSAVCHGPAALVNARLSDGSLLVAGKRVAAFTDDEEAAVQLTEVVPFLLADTLRSRGAQHTQAGNFEPHVEVDGRLLTGQNPASATPLGRTLAGILQGAAV